MLSVVLQRAFHPQCEESKHKCVENGLEWVNRHKERDSISEERGT